MHGPESADRIAPDQAVETAPSSFVERNSGRALVRRVLIYLPSSVVPAVLTLLTSMIFTRIFTPTEFGMFSLVAVVVAIPVKTLSTTWLIQSVGKFLPPEQTAEGRRRIVDAAFFASGTIAIVQCAAGGLAILIGRSVLSEGWHEFLLPALLFVIAMTLFEVLSAVLTAEAQARAYTTYKLVDSVVTFGLRLLFVSSVFNMSITLMLVSVALSNGALVPLMWRRVGYPAPHRFLRLVRSAETRRTARSFVRFGFPMTLFLFATIMLDVGDRWVIKALLGADAVGIYDANYRLIAGVATLLVVPVTITVHPFVMGLSGAVDEKQVGRVIGTVIDNLVIVALLAVGVTALFHADMARILLGPEFRGGSMIMPVVLAGVFFANVGLFAHKPFEIHGRTRPMVLTAFASAAANLVFCFALIPVIGYAGAAYATLLAYLLYCLVIGVLGRRIIPWRLNWRWILGQAAVIAAGVAGIATLRHLLALTYIVELATAFLATCMLSAVILLGVLRRARNGSPKGEDA